VPVANPPGEFGGPLEQRAGAAWWRYRVFQTVGAILAVVFLAGIGFQELYVANPTFGENPWLDHLTVLVWGFGAEATRASITAVIRGWGVASVQGPGGG
jgi:hypothetical protein